jgi:phosphohistidine phosphatase
MRKMRLHIVRHAEAGASEDWVGSDFERPITALGRARTEALGQYLKAIGISPDRVITSPMARAEQTARIIAEAVDKIDALSQDERLDKKFGMDRLAVIIADNPRVGELLVVGHQPTLTKVIAELIGGGSVAMKKGAIATLDLKIPANAGRPFGTLQWLLPPGAIPR